MSTCAPTIVVRACGGCAGSSQRRSVVCESPTSVAFRAPPPRRSGGLEGECSFHLLMLSALPIPYPPTRVFRGKEVANGRRWGMKVRYRRRFEMRVSKLCALSPNQVWAAARNPALVQRVARSAVTHLSKTQKPAPKRLFAFELKFFSHTISECCKF